MSNIGEDYKTKYPEGPKGWYWALSEEGPVHGPFETREKAVVAFQETDEAQELFQDHLMKVDDPVAWTLDAFCNEWEFVMELGRAAIHTDIFAADDVFETMNDRNELAVWDEAMPEFPQGEAKRELELMLSDALYRWCDKHNVWSEFRLLT